MKDQAVWALGNIAGDGPKCRDYMLQCGVMPALLTVFSDNAPMGILRNATCALSNLCRGKPAPEFDRVCIDDDDDGLALEYWWLTPLH